LFLEYHRKKINLTEIPKQYIPRAKRLYYCSDDCHEKETKKGKPEFYYSEKGFIFIFNAKEIVSFHLFTQTNEVVEFLLSNNIKQRRRRNRLFNEETLINDFDSALLSQISTDYCFNENVDISFSFLMNFDGANLNRNSDEFRSVIPIYLKNLNLPVGVRDAKENLIVLGFYCGKRKSILI
jgi:hypothetical protein